ncbi:hypothetical protein HPB50_004091 [Hyalomma asiaticum]|uniref:Uncharacterized protein n=1 Tax=Hyalomma asiaticum TaxID=266040 RepID=A0ACB7TEU9_HYAAI|nr:hypothetical protein HPB50_004091 [Hyalomma asiaticum]
MASRFEGQAGYGTRERLRLTKQGLNGRGYAFSWMVATSRKSRGHMQGDNKGATDMWMPHPRKPCGDGSASSASSATEKAGCNMGTQLSFQSFCRSIGSQRGCFHSSWTTARRVGGRTGDRLQLTEQGLTGRGYALSCTVANKRTIRDKTHGNTTEATDMWRPHATNPYVQEASVRSGNRSSEGGLPHGESVRRAERWLVQEAEFNSRRKASGRGGGYAISCMVATSRKIRDHIHDNTTRANGCGCLMQETDVQERLNQAVLKRETNS